MALYASGKLSRGKPFFLWRMRPDGRQADTHPARRSSNFFDNNDEGL
jgi:hypothetical protein